MSLSHCKYKDVQKYLLIKYFLGNLRLFLSVRHTDIWQRDEMRFFLWCLQHVVFPGLVTSGRCLLVQYEAFPALQAGNSGTLEAGDIKEVQETWGRVFSRAQATCEGGITTALWLQGALPSRHRAQKKQHIVSLQKKRAKNGSLYLQRDERCHVYNRHICDEYICHPCALVDKWEC